MVLVDGSCVPRDASDAADDIANALLSQGKSALAQELINEALPENLSPALQSCLVRSMAEMADRAMVDYTASMAA